MTNQHRHSRTSARPFSVAVLTLMFGALISLNAVAQDTCPEADSTGVNPADPAINNCLQRSSWVTLPGGTYKITATINVTQSGAEFSSVPGQTATLVGDPSLVGPIVHAGQGANNYSVHDLHLDGGLYSGSTCAMRNGNNLAADGSDYSIFFIASINAPCANMAVGGDRIHIHDNFLWHSGIPAPQGGPVGDGLDVFFGTGGEIYSNTISEATDIGLIMWGGLNRRVHDNRIENHDSYGLAGFNVGSQGNDVPGDHSGSTYERNHVISDYNMLGIGLLLGAHPWSTAPGDDVSNAGTFINNDSSGAVINMMVEGIANIEAMYGNTTSNHQGTRGVGTDCNDPTGGQDSRYEYTAWHFGGQIQSGWFGMQADEVVGLPNACIPQG